MIKAKILRKGLGFTQDEISKKLGISRPTLIKKEKGELEYTKKEIIILEKLFNERKPGITKDDIFFKD